MCQATGQITQSGSNDGAGTVEHGDLRERTGFAQNEACLLAVSSLLHPQMGE
jgi:hypothetical protein